MAKIIIQILLLIFTLISCTQKMSEISKAKKNVNEAEDYVKSDEAKNKLNWIVKENESTIRISKKIDSSNSNLLIDSKNEIINISNNLFNNIEAIDESIKLLHGIDKYGEIINKREKKYVNLNMLELKMASKLKAAIQETIQESMKIIFKNDINISKEELPLNLNLFMEGSFNKTWEEFTFKNMPYGAVEPIFSKYKRDVIMTKLMVLQELEKKVNN